MAQVLEKSRETNVGYIREEYAKCAQSPGYFIDTYVQIEDATLGQWVPFKLWPAQVKTLREVHNHRLSVILKARQLGLTWLVLSYILWRKLFRPATTALLFSKREDEAKHLLERLTSMWERLPDWLQLGQAVTDNTLVWELDSGSEARAFPTSAGDSYTASIVLADEFDLVEDQGSLINAVKPTIDGGGQMILLSRVDKKRPQTQFKNIYRAAVEGRNPWHPIFLPWFVRPDRDQAWYQDQVADSMARTNSLDDVHEQYPRTPQEALRAPTIGKRIAAAWLDACYLHLAPLVLPGAPATPGLKIYKRPEYGRKYIGGADVAEGNPTSDDSTLTVIDAATGEEVASLAGKFQPAVLAANIKSVCGYFNKAPTMVERNNHGHSTILWLQEHAREITLLPGLDGKPGWLSTTLGKTRLYDDVADAFRNHEVLVHTLETYLQLASIEGGTLLAPEGELEDLADSFALCVVGRTHRGGSFGQSNYVTGQGYGGK